MLALALVLATAANLLMISTALVLWVKRKSPDRIEGGAADELCQALDTESMPCRAPSPHSAFECTEPMGHWGWHRNEEVAWWGNASTDDGTATSTRHTQQASPAPKAQPIQKAAPPELVNEAPAKPPSRTSRRKPAQPKTSFASSHLGFSFDDPPYKSRKTA